MKRRLPTGIQTFAKIRADPYYYLDKTACVERLMEVGKHFFLSRPRRFGKSLLLDTLKELFEGNEPLFRGLAIHDRWDWSVRSPVIRLDFGGGNYRDLAGVESSVAVQLDAIESAAGITPRFHSAPERFHFLIRTLSEKHGRRVVVLVDEYDKPILDVLADPEAAELNRDFLRGLYGTVKSMDAHVEFSFFTGVSKFTKVSLFSDLNNLLDITLDPRFANICGYTEKDLDEVFAPELEGLDRERIREWYNGYGWLGEERVYNPYDILLLFGTRMFRAHWFETGSPAFVIQLLKERRVFTPALDGLLTTEELLSKFDVRRMGTEGLLFQIGYLTVVGAEEVWEEMQYRLGYPNREVRQSLHRNLLEEVTPEGAAPLAASGRFRSALVAGDLNRIESLIRALFDAIPYEWHTRNEIARFEGYYASVLYSYLMATGLEIVVEDSSRRGRADLAVRCGGRVYLFEAKVVGSKPTGAALAQLPMERRSPERHFRVRLRCSSKQHDSPAGHVTVRVPLPPVQEHTAASCRTGVQNSMQGRTS